MGKGKHSKIQDYSDTMDQLIQQALKKRERALRQIEEVKVIMIEAQNTGLDASQPSALLNKAQNILGNIQEMKEYDEVLELIENARRMVTFQHEQFKQTTYLISSAKETIAKVQDESISVAEPHKLIMKAEEELNNKRYANARDFATKSIEMVKLKKHNQQKASKFIKDAIGKIHTAKSKNLNTFEAEKLLDEAASNLAEHSYKSAVELAKESITLAENAVPLSIPEPPSGPPPEPEPVHEPEPEQKVAQSPAIEKVPQQPTPKLEGKPIIKLKPTGNGIFKSNMWCKLEVELSNEGTVQANDIEFKISDDVESRGIKTINKLKPGEKKTIGFGIRTEEIGEIPVSVDLSFINSSNDEEKVLQEIIWITTEREPSTSAAGERLAPERVKMPKSEGEVKVLSEMEVFQGFVRLKVGLKNDMNTVITDAKFDLEFDDTAMRLDHIEPPFERRGNKVIFGVIHPQEKRTVAFYLDPVICTESHVDGTLVFKDIYGELKTTGMKRRKAEVVCPIMYTPENINTAMLQRLITEELTIHDSKIYKIPPGLDFERAMSVCKDTIQAHDLKFIREFVERDSEDPEIESWYYGTTKVKKHRVIIKASTRRRTKTIELFVACKDKFVITGFLAELGHNLNDRLRELGITKQPIFPVTDDSTREVISQTNTLLQHQYSEKATLSISKRGNEYEVSFKPSEERGEASELCEFIKVSPDSRLDVIDQINSIVTVLNIFTCTRSIDGPEKDEVLKKAGISDNLEGSLIEDKIRDLSSLGKLIYTMFLPFPIQKHLETVKEPIILKTNDNEIPWELLHDDNDFLCLKVPIGRRLRSREIPRSNQTIGSNRIKILFIANPTGDLEGAEEEVDYIIKHLDPSIEVDVLKGSQATNASVLSAIRSGSYDIIHYSGHAEFNIEQPDESALICANKRKIYAQEIKRIMGGKPFVFLNACGSGREKMCEEGESYSGSDTEGLASSFILGGSLAFIGSSWPLPDISAGILASEFYKNVLAGDPVGDALHKARLHLKNERPDDINWMAFILYGDPTIKLMKKV